MPVSARLPCLLAAFAASAAGAASAVGPAPSGAPSPLAPPPAAQAPAALAPIRLAVTVDDLPANGDETPGLSRMEIAKQFLAAFKRHGLERVYGFANGLTVRKHPETFMILKAWLAAGHFLGNHTWSHPAFDSMSVADFSQDIAANEKLLSSLAPERDYKWFRFPYLSEGNTAGKRTALRAFLSKGGYRIAPVTVDFQDWLWNEAYERCLAARSQPGIDELKALYLRHALAHLRLARLKGRELFGTDPPQVLLLHINAFTAIMLDPLFTAYHEQGVTFADFRSVMQDHALRSDPGMPEPSGDDLYSAVLLARRLPEPAFALPPDPPLDGMCR